MHKGRLEAFSDGVLAILITIMVLELHVPKGADLAALGAVAPTLLGYLLSFVFIAIYWNNHHHMLQAVRHVSGGVLWANLNLLFWLSLVPWTTAWMGDHPFTPYPVAVYGVVLLMSGLSYFMLSRVLVAVHGPESTIARALGGDLKGVMSLVLYLTAIGLAFLDPRLSCALYVAVAVMWLVPDRRFERALQGEGGPAA